MTHSTVKLTLPLLALFAALHDALLGSSGCQS
jgi:hypothetical protein